MSPWLPGRHSPWRLSARPAESPPDLRRGAEGRGSRAHPRPTGHLSGASLRPQVKEPQRRCTIHDAWSGARHVVQLRAQEEFGHGLWSEWSQAVLGTPWTGTVGRGGGEGGSLRLCSRIGYLLLGNKSPKDEGKIATVYPLAIADTGQPGSSRVTDAAAEACVVRGGLAGPANVPDGGAGRWPRPLFSPPPVSVPEGDVLSQLDGNRRQGFAAMFNLPQLLMLFVFKKMLKVIIIASGGNYY